MKTLICEEGVNHTSVPLIAKNHTRTLINGLGHPCVNTLSGFYKELFARLFWFGGCILGLFLEFFMHSIDRKMQKLLQ